MGRAPKAPKEYTCDDDTKKSVWFITKNNIPQDPTTNWKEYFSQFIKLEEIRWMVWQVELGSSKAHYHIHAVISYYSAKRFRTIHSSFEQPHLKWLDSRERKDEFNQKILYCQKERTRVSGPYTHGYIPKTQGERTDLLQIRDMAKKGMDFTQIVDVDEVCASAMRCVKAIDRISDSSEERRRSALGQIPTEVICLYGKSGTGKTHDAFHKYGSAVKVESQNDKLYLSNYNPKVHKTLVIDEFKSNIPLFLLLQIMDGYPTSFAVRYGTVWNWWDRVVITSQNSPKEWYPNITEEEREALMTRFDKVIYYNGQNRRLSKKQTQWVTNTDGKETINK